MKILKAVIVDDEPSARDTLGELILKYCSNVQLVASCGSVDEAATLIRQYMPDIVFLDVDMPVKDGFTLLKQPFETPFKTIFTTAYNQYALKAIKFSALDYLLKPIDIDELRAAVAKAGLDGEPARQMEVLQSHLKNSPNKLNKIILPTQNGYSVELLDQVIRCESDSNYTIFHFTDNRKIAVCKVLKEYEELLQDHGFLRIHQSHLINIKHIRKYFKGSSPYLVMTDGEMVSIARNKKSDFLHTFFDNLIS
jgi:two-component system, LytTR family, response regulator